MAAKDISLVGATFYAVPQVDLPINGGGTASFVEISDTTATAADVASGKYFYTSAGVKTEGTASGGGGASNVVQGTFTTKSSSGHEEVSIPYSGTGYPVAAVVFVKGGPYNANNAWYNTLHQYATGLWVLSKADTTTAPTYATSGTSNRGVVMNLYKSSASNATQYSRTGSQTANIYTSATTYGDANGSLLIRFSGNGKTLSYYVSASSYGLLANTEYQYIIVYSS